MQVLIQLTGYSICAAAFLLLTLLVVISRAEARYKYVIAAGCAISALWAGSIVAIPMLGIGPLPSVVFELSRNVVWLILLGSLLGVDRKDQVGRLRQAGLGVMIAIAVGVILAGEFADILLDNVDLQAGFMTFADGARVLLVVLGLLLLENLYRNADEDGRWAVKFLCFGLGAVFAYDFFLYADAALFHQIDATIYDARGFVNFLAVPLIAVGLSRSQSWRVDLHVSRKIVFHSAALLGSGLYLLIMSAAGFYVKKFGGEWGAVFRVVFLTGTAIFLVVIFSSGSVRARIKVWVSKHFYSYKYDYREEWLRFARTISLDAQRTSLYDRIVHAIANIVESTAGGLWVLRQEDQAYFPAASWNLGGGVTGAALPSEPMDSALIRFLDRTNWVIDLGEFRLDPNHYENLVVPGWLRDHPRARLVVPLVYRETLCAFLILGEPRTERRFDWEDHDFLKTVGAHAASYLAEAEAANALSDAQRIEGFSRRSAFLIHDIKNLVSQMSLMLQNAERFGDNEEFRKDMMATVSNSVLRMRKLLVQFKDEQARSPAGMGRFALHAVVERVAETWRQQKPDLGVELAGGEFEIAGDEERMVSVLDHLLQNAIEVTGAEGRIILRLMGAGDDAVVEVEDDGPGMDSEFIRDQLFRPLDTDKASGYGLGAYQTRQLVREMGGRLEVISTPGEGTIMRILLPMAGAGLSDAPRKVRSAGS